jgi:hypothetical protein
MFTTTAQVVTSRQVQTLKARCTVWLRSEFVKWLKVNRTTAYRWDLILLESVEDYARDWEPGKPWNPYQQWCLLKVKLWMAQSTKPTFEDLRSHLTLNQSFSYQQFDFHLKQNEAKK